MMVKQMTKYEVQENKKNQIEILSFTIISCSKKLGEKTANYSTVRRLFVSKFYCLRIFRIIKFKVQCLNISPQLYRICT